MRTTQTICTIGPASESPEILEQLVVTGMDVVRLNFSHATFDQFRNIQAIIHHLNAKHNKSVQLLVDLQGPRIRVGVLPNKGIKLEEGQVITFSTDPHTTSAIYINDPYLHKDIQPKQPLYLANGDIELHVEKTEAMNIIAHVVRGGTLYSRKAVNVPETDLTTSGITDKDIKDIQFAIEHKADFIAMSFVKNAEEVQKLRVMIQGTPIQIVSKIESKQGLTDIDNIIKASDAIMIARGDLGIEVPLEEVPLLQKAIIKKCHHFKKPSIVATQMLMSMTAHYRPTRAEVSDAANAVLDGTEYLMLSDETAFGKYPVEALEYLIKVINKVEQFSTTSA